MESERGTSRRAATNAEKLPGAPGAGAVGMTTSSESPADQEDALPETVVKHGRINQSLAQWCYEPFWNLEELCQIANQLGCKSIELVQPEGWPTLKEHGLTCALALSHWFEEGMNNPKYQPMCIGKMREAIDASAEAGFPNVLTFTGFREDISDEDGITNCVQGYKKIVGYAEERGVTLCLEMLNSRIDIEMKGHPGYQGDHIDYVMEIIRQVGSQRLKLLFDIYHVQVMDGDIIARIHEHGDYIGHYHVAGNPGRGELNDSQEIQYRGIMKAIVKIGYTGFVGQEFLPTGDPLAGLREAVSICDV